MNNVASEATAGKASITTLAGMKLYQEELRARFATKLGGTHGEKSKLYALETAEAEAIEALPPISGGSPEADDVEEGSSAWMNRFARRGWAGPSSPPDGPIRDEDIYPAGCAS